MNYIYRYTDLSDGIIKYVGIVCREGEGQEGLLKRVYEHGNNDKWCFGKKWRVDFSELKTKNDAHALEAHYIAKYETYKWNNISKKDYGLLSFFVGDLKWERLLDDFTVSDREKEVYARTFEEDNLSKVLFVTKECTERLGEILSALANIELIEKNGFKGFLKEQVILDRKALKDEYERLSDAQYKISLSVFDKIGLV